MGVRLELTRSTTMTWRPQQKKTALFPPPQFHNQFPWKYKKRCVLITQHWCYTQGCPHLPSHLHGIKLTQPERETHTTFCPCSCEWLCQKIRGCLPKQSHAFCRSQSQRVRQVLKQIRQQKNSTTESRFRSRSAPSSPKNGSPHPRTECSSMGGFWGGTSVLCVFVQMCVPEPEGIVETITLNSAMRKEWQFSMLHYASSVYEKMNWGEYLIFGEMSPNGCKKKKKRKKQWAW